MLVMLNAINVLVMLNAISSNHTCNKNIPSLLVNGGGGYILTQRLTYRDELNPQQGSSFKYPCRRPNSISY